MGVSRVGQEFRELSRWWRRFRRRFRPPPARFIYNSLYEFELSALPVDGLRAQRILSFLATEELLGRRAVAEGRPVSMRSLQRVHSDAYLDALEQTEYLTRLLGTRLTDADHDRFLTFQRAVVGGTVEAARLALRDRQLAINLGGGLHHAHADSGQGFCAFNDVATAVADARQRGFDAPVLVVDLDLHDGDGTRAIFADDPSVHTFSIHNRTLGAPDALASTTIELGDDVGDERYLANVERHLPGLLQGHRPGLVFYLAGCDPAADDELGNWRISVGGMLERDQFVIDRIRELAAESAVIVLLAGGYGQEAWRYSARFLAWAISGSTDHEPPQTGDWTMSEFRRIARVLSLGELTHEPDGGAWSLTEEDLMPVRRESRLLGFYSRHGIEIGLERYGLFDRLRAKGFRDLRLDLELDNPAGQTVRVRTGGDAPESLIELRMRRNRRSLEGFELLIVEWLLMQNPHAHFDSGRPRLPGQNYPGLGLLREVSAILVLICERLQLDGVGFVPMHYHIAAQAQRHFTFAEPEDEGRFLRLREALDELTLLEAIRALEQKRLFDTQLGRPFRWTPATMVLPVSDRLKARIERPEREQAVRRAMQGYRFELRPE
jgi:acetoin utilization deacetylase AcuC-like enzyme